MHEKKQTSETFIFSSILALSGGFQDAYTYNLRDNVFSNAQTGNVVLMTQHLMLGEWSSALHYLLPLAAFILGVMAAEMINDRYKEARRIHWRQIILIIEILILFLSGFMPQHLNSLSTMLISFSCAMQVQSFRKMNGLAYASTMCIGNMRSGTDNLSKFIRTRNKSCLEKAVYYFGIIFVFAIGAGLGGLISLHLGFKAIWISCLLLIVGCVMMIRETI